MLQWLRLRDFVIVESAEIEFGPGFTVLTGETGAGKSILLDAMGLVLGGRGDATLVREGAERADISALFGIDDTLAAWLAEHDLAGDPGQLLLRRIVEKDGRSRAQINGHPSTIARLRELGEQLVDIHGQHESQHLLRPGAQRELLDRLAGQERLLADLAQGWQRWQQASRALEAARSGSREEAIRIERLQWEIDELTQLRLAPGEWEALSAEQQRLAHAHDLLAGADALANALERDEDAIAGRLGSLQGRLRALAEIDPALKNAAELVDSAVIQIDEAASELAAYAARVDLDPERFAEVEQRVAALFNTARKLRLQPQDLASHLEGLQAELEQLGAAVDIEKLEAASTEAEAAYRKLAEKVSAARKKTAARLAGEVTEQIERLGMPGTRLLIACTPATPGPSGIDAVEFQIAHEGATPRPIARVASGGELSRIGLAIAVLAARSAPVSILIFDEADTGVGGAVAAVIGELMQRLAAESQVLCVTHLPQVAARADHHLKVLKTRSAHSVSSRVERLDEAARQEEIARMLGGKKITGTTRAHAAELLEASRR
ncbi:MAG: DNA repair protein RecN [Lautropia mirabilis]|nr:DNA repair protein RecN [Lautropia mirabilis]